MNSLESCWFKDFCTALRHDFLPPSAYLLKKTQSEVYEEVCLNVQSTLKRWGCCSLAMDAWEDQHHTEIVAVAATPHGQKSLLIHFARLLDRPTGEVLHGILQVSFFFFGS